MLILLVMLTLFIRPIYSTVLTVINISSESGQMGILYLVVALCDYAYIGYRIIKKKGIVSGQFLLAMVFVALVLAAMLITGSLYGRDIHVLRSTILSFGSMTACAILIGVCLAKEEKLEALGLWIPIYVIALTIMCVLSILFGNTDATGLIRRNTNDISYQNGAYFAAYALGLNLYYLTNYEMLFENKVLRLIRPIFRILPFLQFYTVCVAGGRGGFVLAIILIALYLYINRQKLIQQRIIIGISRIVLILLIVMAIFHNKISFASSGFSRIRAFLIMRSDSNRSALWSEAINGFKESIVVGNGVGSVWYIIGIYSHNLFLDLLCETGLVGTAMLVFVIIKYFVNQKKAIQLNPLNQFPLLIFICGFTMSMFSGYYLTNPQLWFSIFYVLSYSSWHKFEAYKMEIEKIN